MIDSPQKVQAGNERLLGQSYLVPLPKHLGVDEHLPLIARNHAARLIKKIEK